MEVRVGACTTAACVGGYMISTALGLSPHVLRLSQDAASLLLCHSRAGNEVHCRHG
jgi:hypothetical protein